MLEPVDCKPVTPNKREILKYSRRDTFQNISKYTFPGKFSTISEHFSPAKHFSWSLILLKSEILICRPIKLEKKGQFCLQFYSFENFRDFRFYCPFWAILEIICSEVFSPVVSSTL